MIKYLKWFVSVSIIFALSSLILVRDVYAYLEPGTTNYILQLFIGLLIGGLTAIKLYWSKIKPCFKSLFNKLRRRKI